MGLTLGKSFNRCYTTRVPFLDGYYNIGTFFNKRSPFLLFRIDADFENASSYELHYQIGKNKKEAYYYGQVYPEEITLKFRLKDG